MTTSEKKLLEEYEFTRFKEIVIDLVGEEDWKNSKANYIKQFLTFSEFDDGKAKILGIVEDAQTSIDKKIADYNAGMAVEPINNHAAYLNTCLQRAIAEYSETSGKPATPDVKKQSTSTTNLINVNLSEVNPGWLTTKLMNKERIFEFENPDGSKSRIEIKNPNPEGYTLNVETVKLEYVIEQYYHDKIVNTTQESRYKDNRKLELYAGDLLKKLNWDTNGRAYAKLKTHLNILRQTDINTYKLYKYKTGNEVKDIPQSRSFTIIEDLEFYYEKGLDAAEKRLKIRFKLCEFFALNVQNGYFSVISNKVVRLLEAPIEYYLGVLIERRRGKDSSKKPININMTDFALESGMITKDPKEQKYNLVNALESLKSKKLIQGFSIKDKIIAIYF